MAVLKLIRLIYVIGFSGIIFNKIIDPLYFFFFKKTMLIHFYPLGLKKLNNHQRFILEQNFKFYQRLTLKRKTYFEHRVCKFIQTYEFIGNDISITDEIKILIAGTYIKLTFGMRKYLLDNFNKIIIYPNIYRSKYTNENHKGEFNPKLKIIVFSWKDFLKGFQNDSDNINLGLHEFTHAIHFNSLKSNEMSAIVFFDEFQKILKILKDQKAIQKIQNANYFRDYAYENQFEFLAVLLEHFFETPHVFKKEFPDLFEHVGKMINFDESLIY